MSRSVAPCEVNVLNRQRGFVIDGAQLADAIGKALELEGLSGHEVTVVLLSDRGMKKLNREYRGINAATDVISFAMREGEYGDVSGTLLGDLAISLETVYRQSTEEHPDGRPITGTPRRQLALMTIHGLLHLLGFDHELSAENEQTMIARETDLFARTWEFFPDFGPPTPR